MLIKAKAITNGGSGFEAPTLIKTVAESNDYIFMFDESGTPYKITKANLLAGLSSSGNSGSSSSSNFSSVVFQSHFNGNNGNTIFTDIKGHPITSFGNAQISTAQSKFNGSSLLLDGNGDYLQVANSSDWNFATSDFTIELFFRPTALSTYHALINRWTNSQQSYQLFLENSKVVLYWKAFSSGAPLLSSGNVSVAVGNWYYCALTKHGTDFSLRLNDSLVGTANFDGYSDSTAPLQIGTQDGSFYFNGNIAELRISKIVQATSIPLVPFPDN